MKKLISVIMAVGMLAFSASVGHAAVTVSSITGGRNGQTTAVTNIANKNTMPCFRPGDTVSFTVSGVTASNELTVISSKYNESLSDSTVQYINQYTLGSSSKAISYTVRDQADGIYQIKINDSVNTVATFYYKVGSADMAMIIQSGAAAGTPYYAQQFGDKWSVGFIGRASLGSADISFADIGATPGFEVTDNTHTHKYGLQGSALDTFFSGPQTNNLEINGTYTVIYGMTMYDVPAQNTVTARAVVDGIE